MPRRLLLRLLPPLLCAVVFLVLSWEAMAWVALNNLPDGHQNEFLHVGNALDLWGAWVQRDSWHLRYYLSGNYWPPGFYLWPWPVFSAWGAGHAAMVYAGLGHVALLMWATWKLTCRLAGPWAGALSVGLLAVYPSVFGNMVRYEPNLAVAAWVTLGAWLLLRSEGFSRRGDAVLFGLACGIGLLMDRLSLAVFLGLPAVLELLRGLRHGGRGARVLNALIGLSLMLAVSGWWHVVFVQEHLQELLSQGGVGEIDAAGQLTEDRPMLSVRNLLYYPASLLDTQAGLLPGALGVVAVGAGLWAGRARRVPVLVVLSSVLLFTLVQKKQAFYTVPMLGCVAALSAAWISRRASAPWLAAGVLLVGLHQHGTQLWGKGLPLPGWLGEGVLPSAWVEPRHPQALQPRGLRLPLDSLASVLGQGDVVVFSEDQTWFEGYVLLQLRERLPGARIRGVISDPTGTYEWLGTASAFVYVSEDSGPDWPTRGRLEQHLQQHHYTLDDLPPVVDSVLSAEERFQLVAWWPLDDGRRVRAYRWIVDEG